VRLAHWQVQQRERGSVRQRAATAALAQFIAVAEEFQDLYRDAQAQRRALARTQRLTDRLAREAVGAREMERARIAHQIHDTAAQSMVSAYRFLSASIAAGETKSGEDARAYGAMALDRLQTAIGEVRSVLGQLVPPGLELGLSQAIRYRHAVLVAEASLAGTVSGELPRLHDAIEQSLYGMVAEAMANAAAHAQARNLDVDLRVVGQRLVIEVRDDGIGLAGARHAARAVAGRGLGLPGIVRQAGWLGGSARISGRAPRGTRVRISIPVQRYRADGGPTAAAPGSTGQE
jgi:signal transduction histidine kinase